METSEDLLSLVWGLWMTHRHSFYWKNGNTYIVPFKDKEEHKYCQGKTVQYIQLQEISVGEIGYHFLREYKGEYSSCKVEKIILKQHVAVYPFLEKIDGKKKDGQYWVLEKQVHNYSLG